MCVRKRVASISLCKIYHKIKHVLGPGKSKLSAQTISYY